MRHQTKTLLMLAAGATTVMGAAAPAPAQSGGRNPYMSVAGRLSKAGGKWRYEAHGQFVVLPDERTAATCNGSVKSTLKVKGKTVLTKTVAVQSNCTFTVKATLSRTAAKRIPSTAKNATGTFFFAGNGTFAPANVTTTIPVRR